MVRDLKVLGLSARCITMRVLSACVLASAAAFLGMRAPLPVKTPRVVKAPAVAMSSALAEESGVSLSSGGGMFTTSSPEDRRIGTELLVSGVRYRERRYPEVKSAHRPQSCAEAAKASTAAPRGASAARGAPVTKSSGAERRLAGESERSQTQRNVGARAPHPWDGAAPSTAYGRRRGRRRRLGSYASTAAAERFRAAAAQHTSHRHHDRNSPMNRTGTRPPRRTRLEREPL